MYLKRSGSLAVLLSLVAVLCFGATFTVSGHLLWWSCGVALLSSLIAALWLRNTSRPVRAFSIGVFIAVILRLLILFY